jgi:hypothetical protein
LEQNGADNSNGVPPAPPTPRLSDEEIRFRAYLKWEAAGKPKGEDARFWQEAKQELESVAH